MSLVSRSVTPSKPPARPPAQTSGPHSRLRQAWLALGAAGLMPLVGALLVWGDLDTLRRWLGFTAFYRQLIGASVILWSLAVGAWLITLIGRHLWQSRLDHPLVTPQHVAFRLAGWQHLLSIFILFVCVWGAFWNSFKYSGWVLDNLYIIKYDPRHRAVTWDDGTGPIDPGVKQIFMQDYWWPKGISGLFRPITTFTYWLNYTALGDKTDTTYFHVVNFFLHWANASLVYVLAVKLVGRWPLALAAGALFAVHPITVESVTNIIGRADQFAALIVLLGLLTWMRAGRSNGWRAVGWFIGVMLLTAFGVFAKESALAIGLVLVAYDLVYRWSPRFTRFFSILVGCLVVTLVAGMGIGAPVTELSVPRAVLGTVVAATAVASYVLFSLKLPDKPLLGMVFGAAVATAANALVPLSGAGAVVLAGAFELFRRRGIWDDAADLWPIRFTAAWYTLAFVALLAVPMLSGRYFGDPDRFMFADDPIAKPIGMEPVTIGACYARAAFAAGAGIFIYLLTLRSARHVRVAALALAICAAVIASLHVHWFGMVVVFVIGTIELMRQADAPQALVDCLSWRTLLNRFVVGYFLLLPPALAMYFVRSWVFANSTPPETPFLDNPLRGGPFDPLPFWQTRLTAIKVIGKLTYLLFWPVHLSSDYSYAQIPLFTWNLLAWENLKTLVALAFVIGCFAAAVYYYKRDKALCFYILFFYAALLPTSNLIQLIGSIMAERFMYLPLIGFTGAIVLVAAKLFSVLGNRAEPATAQPDRGFKPIRLSYIVVPSLVVILFTARTFVRNYDWFSDRTLWESALKTSPRSFRSYQSLAFALFEEHAQQNIDRMISVAQGALPIVDALPDNWNSSRLYLHLGMYYQVKGDMLAVRGADGNLVPSDAGREWYGKAVEVLERASKVDRAFNAVNARRQADRGDKPEEIFDVGLSPVYAALGNAYFKAGMDREAINAFRYQIHLEPAGDPDPYYRLALTYLRMQRYDECVSSLIQCLLIDSKRMDAWTLLAQVYGMFGDQTAGALSVEQGVPKLNVSHPVVRDHLRDAYRDLIRILRRAKRTEAAEEMRKVAISAYSFPRSIFDSLFAEPLQRVTPQGLEDASPRSQNGVAR